MRPFFGILLLSLLSLPARLPAQGIRATVDRAEATLEDQVLLTVTVEGSRSARPALPPLPDFQVVESGQSTQVKIVNGQMTASVSYSFFLLPQRTGSFTIGATTVEIGGRSYQSRPFQLRILDPGSQPSTSREVFLSAQISDAEPFVGEQVLYIWRFYRRVQVVDAQLTPQDWGGILAEDLGELREFETTVGGQVYLVSEIRKALFPQEPGPVTLPGSQLTCQLVVRSNRRSSSLFDDFFARPHTATKVLRSEPITLEVRPRPAPPRGFGGLVGSFSIAAEISKRDLQVGESATLEITVSGSGNAQMITAPPVPELAALKIYEDQPTASLQRTANGLRGSKVFRRAVVPLEAGEVILPQLSITYFDPEAGAYRKAETAAIRLAVRPADGREELHLTESLAPTTGKVAVRILADDILPIHTELAAAAPLPPWSKGPWWWMALAAPPLLCLLVFAVQRRRLRLASDRGLRRRQGALRRALAELGRGRDAASPADRAEHASRVVRAYIGDLLDREGTALTAAEIDELLRRQRLPEETVVRVRRLLDRLDAAHYGAAEIPQDAAALGEEIRPLLKQLERRIRR